MRWTSLSNLLLRVFTSRAFHRQKAQNDNDSEPLLKQPIKTAVLFVFHLNYTFKNCHRLLSRPVPKPSTHKPRSVNAGKSVSSLELSFSPQFTCKRSKVIHLFMWLKYEGSHTSEWPRHVCEQSSSLLLLVRICVETTRHAFKPLAGATTCFRVYDLFLKPPPTAVFFQNIYFYFELEIWRLIFRLCRTSLPSYLISAACITEWPDVRNWMLGRKHLVRVRLDLFSSITWGFLFIFHSKTQLKLIKNRRADNIAGAVIVAGLH